MNPHLSSTRDIILSFEARIQEDIIGQSGLIRKLMIALFAWGHVLIEWVPGLGKTRIVRTLANVLGYDYSRVSFTPDLLPSDLTGHEIYRPQTAKFEIRKWPIFAHIFLADEINRTPPKVQSALLEAMEEWQITIANETLKLPSPFFVIATQNPLEHDGTYPLPEAELDRFMMKLMIDYPTPTDEKQILMRESGWEKKVKNPKWEISVWEFIEIQSYIAENIHIEPQIYDYISDILEMTRSRHPRGRDDREISDRKQKNSPSSIIFPPSYLSYGASTRAGLALVRAGRVHALLEGRDYVMPDDIKSLAWDILRHRIGLSYEALSGGLTTDTVIRHILDTVRIP